MDALGRPVRDLRISLTDRCNFRCQYCMPKAVFGADYAFLPRAALLSFEEIVRAARVFAGLGVQKLRLTGGEPLLRNGVVNLVDSLAGIDGIEDIALTTNGSRLTPTLARELKAAGLHRITVSLDALSDAIFWAINDVDFPVRKVLDAIDAAVAAGLAPVKVNVVVKRGVNEQEVVPLADYFRGTGCIPRFIEYMDVGNSNGWRMADVVPAADIVAGIAAKWPVEAVNARYPGEVARRYRYLDGQGEFGVIASVTQPFCSQCSRARLSPEGKLFTCLFGADGFDLRKLLRSDVTDETLHKTIEGIWARRADRYSELRTAQTTSQPKVEMSHIGG